MKVSGLSTLPPPFSHCRRAGIEFLQFGRAVTFFSYGAVLKLNRITKVEVIFCRRHFGNALLPAVFLYRINGFLSINSLLDIWSDSPLGDQQGLASNKLEVAMAMVDLLL